MKHEHELIFQYSLKRDVSDEMVSNFLQAAREQLKRLAGPFAREIQFRHKVEERDAKLGYGDKGTDIVVLHIILAMRFNGLPSGEVQALKRRAESERLDKTVREHVRGVVRLQ